MHPKVLFFGTGPKPSLACHFLLARGETFSCKIPSPQGERPSSSDTGWPSDTTASCASTTFTLKFNIIEAWKRSKKKNHQKEAWKCRKKKDAAVKAGPAKAGPTSAKVGPTG
jgi:hypothetical protein